jgi:exonuclease I
MLAVLCENFDTVKLLVDNGADINYHTEKGENALYYATTNDAIRDYLTIHKTNEPLVDTGVVVTIPNTTTVSTTKVEQEVKKPNLELIQHSVDNGYIVGKIKNNTNNTYSYVQVEINLYDGSGNQVDSTITNILNLEPNKIWNFSAVVLNQERVKSYKIVNIQGY